MSFYRMYYPLCTMCGKINQNGNSDIVIAKRAAVFDGWQAIPDQWISDGVEIGWEFYCPIHWVEDETEE